MTIFSPDQLEESLSRDELSSWEKTKYLILFLLINAASAAVPAGILPIAARQHDIRFLSAIVAVLSFVLALFLMYFGIRKCFRVNQAADDHDFAERFLVLYIPAFIKSFVISLFIAILYSFLTVLLSFPGKVPRAWSLYFEFFMAPFTTYLLFTILTRSFNRLAVLVEKNKKEVLTT